jgi:hypothetical protein
MPVSPRIPWCHVTISSWRPPPPDARIRDLGSLNGTYVNGHKVGGRVQDETPAEGTRRAYPEEDLQDGDHIEVGATGLAVHLEALAMCYKCGAAIAEAARAQVRGVVALSSVLRASAGVARQAGQSTHPNQCAASSTAKTSRGRWAWAAGATKSARPAAGTPTPTMLRCCGGYSSRPGRADPAA